MRLRLVPEETHFDFMKFGPIGVAISGFFIVASIVVFFMMGLNFGIDFRGGSMITAATEEPADLSTYRSTLEALDIGDFTVTEISDPAGELTGAVPNQVTMRIEQADGDETIQQDVIAQVKGALTETFPGIVYLQTDSVGAKVSGELVQAGVLAVLLAIGAVLVYIWLRFEWQFSVGAVAALVHDVILTIGVFSLTQIEFNLSIIAAILTIVGYSLNDTVVVFDRVRENLRRFKQTPLAEVLNLSINETLSRTLMTSLTTLIALVALYVLGGEVIRGFSFAMIWGIVVGTYSSIFIASPILLKLDVKRDWSKPEDGGGAGTQFANIDA
ncbi:protein translocase subunit SecF [Algicella marina]|uniref:Protein-export membrane protein SecF n=1 Tax=Algicella marina TaxID=2683284 RepID=A0A6P1SYR4_9RHOB|nr:protein translocase subunit SecF [Algicella marina]QHQ34760.1 protein translocase subunit SecF [Algicella marina]